MLKNLIMPAAEIIPTGAALLPSQSIVQSWVAELQLGWGGTEPRGGQFIIFPLNKCHFF
jgi:hypothetical protein